MINKKIYVFPIIFFVIYFIKYNKNIKVCICTIGKRENLYAREFVEYYKKLGINKIFIYDNNDKNDESFDMVLQDYIKKKFVEIIDIRGIIAPQKQAIEDCRKKNFKNFDWLMFYDFDEFLFLRNYSNVKDFLKQKKFDKCQTIHLNWLFHTDNNLIYYDNRSLAERFPEIDRRYVNQKFGGIEGIKSILRGNIDIEINDIHKLSSKFISCDGFGKIEHIEGITTNYSDHYYYYIDHYWSKSTEEFVNKLNKGSVTYGYVLEHSLKRISIYFSICDITLEKINYIENKTNLNLSKYRLKLKTNFSGIKP